MRRVRLGRGRLTYLTDWAFTFPQLPPAKNAEEAAALGCVGAVAYPRLDKLLKAKGSFPAPVRDAVAGRVSGRLNQRVL